jgi:hypothetical protein
MCLILESVNPNQSPRKGRSSLRSVPCEEMCLPLLTPGDHPPTSARREGQRFVTRPPRHKEAAVRFTIGLFRDLVLF